jgi:hypothetical protein
MKSWNHASDEAAPLIAPPSRPIARDTGGRIRTRALVLTLATCGIIFGLDALFPDVKNGHLPTWKVPEGAQGKPFEWSQVSCHFDFEYDVRGGECDIALYHACAPLAELDQVKCVGYTLQRLDPFLLCLYSKVLAQCYCHYLSSMLLLMLDSTCRTAYFRVSSAYHINL